MEPGEELKALKAEIEKVRSTIERAQSSGYSVDVIVVRLRQLIRDAENLEAADVDQIPTEPKE